MWPLPFTTPLSVRWPVLCSCAFLFNCLVVCFDPFTTLLSLRRPMLCSCMFLFGCSLVCFVL